MMNVCIVSGYVPIPNHPRGPEEYGALGEKLGAVPRHKKAFYMKPQDTWVMKMIRQNKWVPTHSEGDNPAKNSLLYHAVNHEKTAWIAQAAEERPEADVLVWIDYGIFRLPGVTSEAICDFIDRVDDKHLYIPGCWDASPETPDAFPSWRFCGSILACPRNYAILLDLNVRRVFRDHLWSTRNVDWEVNTWARVEASHRLPIHWYKADHDVSLFTNFEAPK